MGASTVSAARLLAQTGLLLGVKGPNTILPYMFPICEPRGVL
jgi:hypothetical protein